MRSTKVDASDIQRADDDRSAADVTNVNSGRGDKAMSVSEVEFFTNADNDFVET
jgi:hypothetical protein